MASTTLIRDLRGLSLTQATAVKKITVSGSQGSGDRRFVFRVDGQYVKLSVSGGVATNTAVATQAVTADSVLSEGNTAAELAQVTSAPGFVGKTVYPAIALSGTIGQSLPTASLAIAYEMAAEKRTWTEESGIYELHGYTIGDAQLEAEATGGSVTVTAALQQNGTWGSYQSLNSIQGQSADAIRFRATYTVKTVGVGSVSIKSLKVHTRSSDAVTAGKDARLVTAIEDFGTTGALYGRLMVKHSPMADGALKAEIAFFRKPRERHKYQIGNGTGVVQDITLEDTGIDFSTMQVFANNAPAEFDFNSLTNTVSLTCEPGAAITAYYSYGIGEETWVEMAPGTTQGYQDGNASTDYAASARGEERGSSCIKLTLSRPTGETRGEELGIGSGFTQTFPLEHAALAGTIKIWSGSEALADDDWLYDPETQSLTVTGEVGKPLAADYSWQENAPRVLGYVAAWNQ